MTLLRRAGQAVFAAGLSTLFFSSPALPSLAVDSAVLSDKGHAFAEAASDVLRNVDGKTLKGALRAATEVALSMDPVKAVAAIDAGLEVLETADAQLLLEVLKVAEKATTASVDAGVLIPPDEYINAVVDAAASVAGTVDSTKVSEFSSKATATLLSAGKGELRGLTFQATKVGLSVGPAKVATATKAAGELVLALRKECLDHVKH